MDELKDLPNKIQGVKIDEFNEFVNNIVTTIISYGESIQETFLINYIFDGYKNSDDAVFNHHFEKEFRKYLKEEVTNLLIFPIS